MTPAQETTMYRYNLTKHSIRNGYIIAKESDGWVLVAPDGSTEFHINSLALARIEADYA